MCDGAAEVTVRTGQHALTRFANSFIHQNVSESVASVSLKLSYDGRTANASMTYDPSGAQLERQRCAALVARTAEAARLRPVDPDWPGLSEPAPTTFTGSYDARDRRRLAGRPCRVGARVRRRSRRSRDGGVLRDRGQRRGVRQLRGPAGGGPDQLRRLSTGLPAPRGPTRPPVVRRARWPISTVWCSVAEPRPGRGARSAQVTSSRATTKWCSSPAAWPT